MNYKEAMALGEKALNVAGISEAKNDAWLLLAYACKIDHTFYYLHLNDDISEEELREYENIIKKRAERIPLQYITGEQEFFGLPFKVDSGVLIPRQDTETLVEEAIKNARPGMKIMDMCTGSGCILISILKNVPDVQGFGFDISKKALQIARENAKMNEVSAFFEKSDLFENVTEQYDMIVSNPPYIPTGDIISLMPEVGQYEPIEALDGMEDGLYFYRKIVMEAKNHLKEGGILLFEIGCEQGQAVSSMMNYAGFTDVRVLKDLAHNDRIVIGHL